MKEFLIKYFMPKFLRDKDKAAPLLAWTYVMLLFGLFWTINSIVGGMNGWDLTLFLFWFGILVFAWIVIPLSQKWFKK